MPQDFIEIGHSIRRLSQAEIGQTALNAAVADLADEVADILANDRNFDRDASMDACDLKEERQ